MEPAAVFTGGSTSFSATDAWAEPLSVIQNCALKMVESPFFQSARKPSPIFFS